MRQRTLSNGLVCVALERPGMLIPSLSLWFSVGTSHGEPERPQTAHLLEHMAMRGPDGDPAGFAAWLESEGAVYNAHVHREWTVFMGRLPNPAVEVGLQALKRIAFTEVAWTEEHLSVERDIVRSELSSQARDPFRRLTGEAKGLLLPGSPYGVSAADQVSSLDRIGLHDVLAFRARHMTPANGMLMICGEGVYSFLDMACGIFQDLPGGPRAHSLDVFPIRLGQRRDFTDRSGAYGAAVAFPGPPYASGDWEVLTMALGLLAYGLGGRLYREAVLTHGLSYQIQTDMEYGRQQGVCAFFARLHTDEGITRFLEIVENAVNDIAEGRFLGTELRRARERYLTFLQLEEEHPQQAAMRHGRHMMITGSPFDLTGAIERLRSVEPPEVARVWSRYLTWNQVAITTVKGKGCRNGCDD